MAPAASPKSWRKTSIWRPASWGPEGRFAGRIWLLKGWWYLANALYTYPFLCSLTSPRKADCKCNRLCCRSVYQYLSGWGMHIPYKFLPASLFLHMRLIGPEVHALSGPRPHQMGCLAYYPSLWGVVVYSCLFEHWKGKAYMRDVFCFFFACFAAARCIGWTRRVLHKQPWWKWLLAPCVASSVASLDTKVPPSVPPSAFPQMIPSIPGIPAPLKTGRSYTSIIWRALALWEKLEKVWTTMPTNGPNKTIQMRKKGGTKLGLSVA